MDLLERLTSNYLINVGFMAWMSAQVIKFLLALIMTRKLQWERLVGAGGIPSSHSALVCAMALGMARKMGFDSPLFALALAFAGIVMYDAMGVRRAAGEQAKVLNKMMKGFNFNLNNIFSFSGSKEEATADEQLEKEAFLKEYLGHTPLEVLCGALLGILVAMLIPLT